MKSMKLQSKFKEHATLSSLLPLPLVAGLLFVACGDSRIEYRDRLQAATTTCDDAGTDAGDDAVADADDASDASDAGADADDASDATDSTVDDAADANDSSIDDASDASDAADAADAANADAADSAPPPWDPTQETGLLLYLDSDLGFTPAQWNDQSGLNHHAVQADTTKQPTLIPNKFNGHASVHVAAGQRMALPFARTSNTTLAFFGRVNPNNSYRCAVMLAGANIYATVPGNNWGGQYGGLLNSTKRFDLYRSLVAQVTNYNAIKLWTDGAPVSVVGAGFITPAVGSWLGSQDTNGASSFDGDVTAVVAYDHVSDALSTKLSTWGQARYAQPLIYTVGNSLMHGFTPPSTTAPIDFITASRPIYKLNKAVGGNTTTYMLANHATQDDYLYFPATPVSVMHVLEGRNDIVLAGKTAQQAYDNLVAYSQAMRAVGFKVVIWTIPPSTSLSNVTRNTVNGNIRTYGLTFADAVADVAADPTCGQDGQNTNPACYVDGVHETDAWAAGMGGIASVAQAPLLN